MLSTRGEGELDQTKYEHQLPSPLVGEGRGGGVAGEGAGFRRCDECSAQGERGSSIKQNTNTSSPLPLWERGGGGGSRVKAPASGDAMNAQHKGRGGARSNKIRTPAPLSPCGRG